MSKLVNVGAGEITDRLTILSLKILRGQESGKDTTHFENEQHVILAKLAPRTMNWLEHALDLATVNGCLWHAEDTLREMRTSTVDGPAWNDTLRQAGLLAFRIQSLNDKRAQIIEAINQKAGDTVGGQEKL